MVFVVKIRSKRNYSHKGTKAQRKEGNHFNEAGENRGVNLNILLKQDNLIK